MHCMSWRICRRCCYITCHETPREAVRCIERVTSAKAVVVVVIVRSRDDAGGAPIDIVVIVARTVDVDGVDAVSSWQSA